MLVTTTLPREWTSLQPYLTEHVTTMYARKRFTADIASDCQGSIKKLHRARMGRCPKGSQGHITAAYSYPTIRERTEARGIKAHPKPGESKSARWSSGWQIVLLVRSWARELTKAKQLLIVVHPCRWWMETSTTEGRTMFTSRHSLTVACSYNQGRDSPP